MLLAGDPARAAVIRNGETQGEYPETVRSVTWQTLAEEKISPTSTPNETYIQYRWSQIALEFHAKVEIFPTRTTRYIHQNFRMAHPDRATAFDPLAVNSLPG